MYTDSLLNNPIKTIRSMLFRVRAYWVIAPKEGIALVGYYPLWVPLSDDPIFHHAHEMGVHRTHNRFTDIMYVGTWGISMLTIPATFVWRFGIWVAMMVISAMRLVLQKRFIWLFTGLPVLTYLATLYLAMGWTDYRYGLPVLFVGMFLPPALLLLTSSGEDDKDEKAKTQ
jgi:hypothetical protein